MMTSIRQLLLSSLLLLTALLPLAHGDNFILLNEVDGRGHGPYLYGTGALLLKGGWKLAIAGQAVHFRSETGGNDYGPFTFTNNAEVILGNDRYRLIFLTAAFEKGEKIGKQCKAMSEALKEALKLDEPGAGVAAIEEARKAQPLARNSFEIEAALKTLNERIAEEQRQLDAGNAKYEGRWMPKAEAEARRNAREEADMRAQGLVKVDGAWITKEEQAQRMREEIAANARLNAAKLREELAHRCPRCNGTGKVYFEIRPGPSMGTSKMPDLRIERPGEPPPGLTVQTESGICRSCGGTGRKP